jgi:predicted amidohydrolase YtcJ
VDDQLSKIILKIEQDHPAGLACLLQSLKTFRMDKMTSYADLIIKNARVFTADLSRPTADAVVVRGSRIVWVGSQAESAEWLGKNTRVIDAGGKTLMPGFIDSHFHMLLGSLNLDDIAFDACLSFDDVVAVVRSFAAENPERAWLNGFGLKYNLGPGNTALNRRHLDEITTDRPLAISAYDGHTTWVNTLALQMAGIFHGGECPPNSEIVLDERGEATGELKERASELIERFLTKPDNGRKRALLKKGLKLVAQMGVTSVHNMDGNAEQAALYAALEDSGELSARIYVPYSVKPETTLAAIQEEALALKSKYQSEMVRGGSVKLFMDGVIETYTGLMVAPYADNPATQGASNYDVEGFNQLVLEADRLGLQIFVHSVGDLGVRRVLDAYALAQSTNGLRDSRHRVEHIEVIHPADIGRFKDLGVIASMQPLHCPPHVDDGDVWPERVGKQRWPLSFAWSSLRQAGAKLVFGSDWPVVSPNPFLGVHNALNRRPWADGLPAHHQDLADTLLSYTREAAYAEFQEHQKGQLRAGYLADMVLLSEDIFASPVENLKNIRALMTCVGGNIVYEV